MNISLALLQKIANYLEQQPFNQVAGLLAEIKSEWDAAQQPKVSSIATPVTAEQDKAA